MKCTAFYPNSTTHRIWSHWINFSISDRCHSPIMCRFKTRGLFCSNTRVFITTAGHLAQVFQIRTFVWLRTISKLHWMLWRLKRMKWLPNGSQVNGIQFFFRIPFEFCIPEAMLFGLKADVENSSNLWYCLTRRSNRQIFGSRGSFTDIGLVTFNVFHIFNHLNKK